MSLHKGSSVPIEGSAVLMYPRSLLRRFPRWLEEDTQT